MPKKKKEPTLTEQINELTARKRSIMNNKSRSAQMMTDYQKRLDDAETAVVEAVTDCMADDTPKNQEAASGARINRNLIMREYETAKHDIAMIPKAVTKLEGQIKALAAQKSILENGVIENKLSNIDDLKEKAREAVATLSAAMCMTSSRNTNFTGVKEVVQQLDRDKSISRLFVHKFSELETNMGFEKL